MSKLVIATALNYQAVVESFKTQEEAEQQIKTESVCWSDEGIKFRVEDSQDYNDAEESNCSYEFLMEQMSK